MTDAQEVLLLCPLCGDQDDYNPSLSTSYGYAEPGDAEKGTIGNPAAGLIERGCYVECGKCGCCGPNRGTAADAVAAWNARAAISAMESMEPSAALDAAHREALGLAKALHRRWYSHVAQWKPLDTVAGIISQIDNMTAGIGERLDTAEIELGRSTIHSSQGE